MFKKTNAKGAFENFHLQNVLFLHFWWLEKQIVKSICNYLRLFLLVYFWYCEDLLIIPDFEILVFWHVYINELLI